MKVFKKIKWILVSFLVSSYSFATDVTLLVVYTDDARVAAGSVANIETQIISAIDDGNESLTNSNVDIDITIVDMRELTVNENNYPNLANLTNDLSNPANGVFGIVHDWRNETAADLVFLVFEGIAANGQANEICGDNFPCTVIDFEEHAFAVGQRGLMNVEPVLVIHELGHVMGLRHDRTRDCGNDNITCQNAAFDYSFGHIDPVGPNWGTVMAGGRPFDLIDFFSNPNLTHPVTGQALGIANYSDASRSLNDVRLIVASFRNDTIGPLEGDGYVCYNAGTSFVLSNPDDLPVTWQKSTNLQIVSSSNMSVTVQAANNTRAPGFIQATVAGTQARKDVWVGEPSSPTSLFGPTSVSYGAIVSYTGSTVEGATSYKWYLPYPYNVKAKVTVDPEYWGILSGGNSRYLSAIVGPNDGLVQFMGKNQCGTGGVKYISVTVVGSGGGGGNMP